MGVDQAQWYPGWVSVEMASVPSFSLAYESQAILFFRRQLFKCSLLIASL